MSISCRPRTRVRSTATHAPKPVREVPAVRPRRVVATSTGAALTTDMGTELSSGLRPAVHRIRTRSDADALARTLDAATLQGVDRLFVDELAVDIAAAVAWQRVEHAHEPTVDVRELDVPGHARREQAR